MKKNLFKILLSAAFALVVCVCVLIAQPVNSAAAEEEEPIMRIVMFADLHVEYDLQAKEKPIRFSIARAAKYARELTWDEGVDVVLVGGDMTGGRGTWKQKYITATTASIYEYMSGITKDGKVMLVTGNHDPEPSAKVDTPAGETYSGDYISFMQEGCGDFVSALYVDDIDGSLSPYGELLCYRYTVKGIEFIGLNTPYVKSQATVCGFYAEQTEWLKEEMKKIGPDKTVFLFCHYPYTSFRTIVNPTTYAKENPCAVDIKQVLNQYPNIVYCYGHVHSGDKWWAKTSTSEIVKPQGTTKLIDRGVYQNSQFIYAHMGSMGYYDNTYQPGGLSATDPMVVQFLMVELYPNRIKFQIHNNGQKNPPNGKEEVSALTIARDLSAQFGLDPSEGVYHKGDAYGGSTDTSSSTTSSSTTDTGATSDTTVTNPIAPGTETNLPSTDSSVNAGTDEGSSNTVLIAVLAVAGVIIVGCVAFLLVFLNKGKKK